MTSSVIPNRRLAALGCLAAVALVAGSSRAEEAAASSARSSPPAAVRATNPFADHFPNLVLKTHQGKNVRFYDDLLKDKIVLINFMYATCTER